MLKIIQAPSEVLSKISKNVEGNPPKIDPKFIKEMEEALDSASDPKGVGLASPQVGKSLSLFIAKPSEKSKLQVFINPRIISLTDKTVPKQKGRRKKKDKKLEGCLSLKDVWGEVKRFDDVEVEYFNQKGIKHIKKFSGFMSTIVQHEVDHLDGILFPKRVLEQKGQLYHSSKDEKGEMIFDPIEI
jgi:peptide deformylase